MFDTPDLRGMMTAGTEESTTESVACDADRLCTRGLLRFDWQYAATGSRHV